MQMGELKIQAFWNGFWCNSYRPENLTPDAATLLASYSECPIALALTLPPLTLQDGEQGCIQGEKDRGISEVVYISDGFPHIASNTASHRPIMIW